MDFDFVLSTSWSDMDISSKSVWARELESRGYSVALITPATDVSDDDISALFCLPEFSTEESISFADIEKKYDIPSLRHLRATEREYFSLTRNDARERTRRLITAYETIFDEHSFEYAVQGRGSEIHRLLLHYYVNATGGTAIWQGFAFFEESFSLQTSLDGTWDTYETIPYEAIPEEDHKWAKGYIKEFCERRKFFSFTGDEGAGGGFDSIDRVRRSLQTINDRLLHREQPGDPKQLIGRAIRQTGNAVINTQLSHSVKASTRLCETVRYVFYPVQFPAESRLTVFSPQFRNQGALIEYLAQILPEDVDLFVKLHPHHPGVQSPRWTYRFVRHPEVEVLHPDVHPHDVLKGAEAVTAINNTPGFESILYGTPLLNLGTAFYSGTPGARSVESLSDLPEELSDAIGSPLPEDRIVESVYSLREAAYDGDVGSSDPDDAVVCVDGLLDFVEAIDE